MGMAWASGGGKLMIGLAAGWRRAGARNARVRLDASRQQCVRHIAHCATPQIGQSNAGSIEDSSRGSSRQVQ